MDIPDRLIIALFLGGVTVYAADRAPVLAAAIGAGLGIAALLGGRCDDDPPQRRQS